MSESQIYQVVRIKQASAILLRTDNKMAESQNKAPSGVRDIKQASATIKWQSHKRIKQASMTKNVRVTNIPSGENKASEYDNKMAESQENKASEYDKKMSESQIYQVV